MKGQWYRIRESLQTFYGSHVKPWYDALTQREQRLVLLVAAVISIAVVDGAIVEPLQSAKTELAKDVTALAAEAREAMTLADQIRQSGGAAQHSDLLTDVEGLARSSGVREYMTRIRALPVGDGVPQLSLQLKSAPYERVIRFIEALDTRKLGLGKVRIQAADQPGLVHFEANISGG